MDFREIIESCKAALGRPVKNDNMPCAGQNAERVSARDIAVFFGKGVESVSVLRESPARGIKSRSQSCPYGRDNESPR